MNGTPFCVLKERGITGGWLNLYVHGASHMSPETIDYVANLLTDQDQLARCASRLAQTPRAGIGQSCGGYCEHVDPGTGTEASYSAAAEKFDCSERWVRKILSEHRTGESELMDKAEQLIEQLECFVKFPREHEPK